VRAGQPEDERGSRDRERGRQREPRCAAARDGRVRRGRHRLRHPSTPGSMGRRMDWLALLLSLVVILGGAELFTNGVEWVGEGFGLSEGAVGSVLAAIGTALPETLLPIVAILGGHAAGKDIGVGPLPGA